MACERDDICTGTGVSELPCALHYRTTHTSSGVNGPFPVWSLKLSEDNLEKEGCENCVTFHSGEVLHVGSVSCFCSANGKAQLCRIFTKGL